MTEMTQFPSDAAEGGVFKQRFTTVLWPILGLSLAGLCTLVWCCFLLWLFSRLY